MMYYIISWGHSPHSKDVFALQKKAFEVVAGLKYGDDCREAFISLKIFNSPCCYIFQCWLYFYENSKKRKYSTRLIYNLEIMLI